MSKTNDPKRRSWIPYSETSDFPIQNIPFGIGEYDITGPKAVSIIGDQVIDLHKLYELGLLNITGLHAYVLKQYFLNQFIALGKSVTNQVRDRIADLYDRDNESEKSLAHQALVSADKVRMHLPVHINDYTDFYSSKEHAYNIGCLFRDPDNALLPNWLHLPVGYHGRASSIVVSGTPITRPKGQQIPNDSKQPVFGPCKLLDFELELGFVIGKSTTLGDSVSTSEAEDHIFGMVLFNDWSARDIQKWEYVPLGPFLGKNFASTASPWIVTMEALEPLRVSGPKQDPEVLPYLQCKGNKNFNIDLSVAIQPEGGDPHIVCRSNFKYMYWNQSQQLAHHTVNGCNIKVGDLYASGTISGPERGSYGSMLEISWKGTKPVDMPDGTQRKFIADGDTVVLSGHGTYEGVRIGFGKCSAKVLPAN